jgi:uncharacterized protein (TIGR02001 family)
VNCIKAFLCSFLLVTSFTTQADTSYNVSVASDYFWRGMSQNAGNVAVAAGVDYNHESGFYAGAWASEVDYDDTANVEYDFYAGYTTDLTDDMSIDLGVIQYNFDGDDYEPFEEVYIGASWKNTSLKYYRNTVDEHLSYLEVLQALTFIKAANVSVGYAENKIGQTEMSHVMLMIAKPVTENLTIGLMVMDGVRSGAFMDSAAINLTLNF